MYKGGIDMFKFHEIDDLEKILNSSFDEIFITDGYGKVLWINEASEQLYGVKQKDIIGKDVNELENTGMFSPSVTSKVLKEKRKVTDKQVTKKGYNLIVTSNPVFDECGNIKNVVTNSRDVTELNRLEQKLVDTEKLLEKYRAEKDELEKKLLSTSKIISSSPAMENVLNMAKKVSKVHSNVLLKGESGVGKGIIAHYIYESGKNIKGEFVTVNCGAIPVNLMESELFGYEEGAFTGASKKGKKGLIEKASNGTIFFDEITEIPLNVQVKLLDFIQNGKIRRVGATKEKNVSTRIIAATNKNIEKLVSEGKFREDLYYRLNVIPIEIPPLRQRKNDIPELIDYFLEKKCKTLGLNKEIATETYQFLADYDWPGNVRELENLIERIIVTAESYKIMPEDLPGYILEAEPEARKINVNEIFCLSEAKEELEKQLLEKALLKYKTTYEVAKALNINQSSIVRKLNKYQMKNN